MGRQLRRCSTRIDINTLFTDFDEKGKRFTANPIGGTLWRAKAAHFMLIKRHFAKKPIVRSWQHADFPWPNPPHVSCCHGLAE